MLKKIKNKKLYRRVRIHQRIRKTLQGTPECPRLSVFRSNKDIYVQLIDDAEGKTLAAASSREKDIAAAAGTKSEKAALVGKAIAVKAKDLGVETVVFDRGGYLYHGRVKSLADAAREAGLKF
jgi:large subunit ribosomal protein L18